nr:12065_t:CDS:10 [Entrophospora candida]
MSSKKKKRFEKYLEKKLKKEERVDLFEKLSKSSYSSNLMKSSKDLGRKKETRKEKLALKYGKHGIDEEESISPPFKKKHKSINSATVDMVGEKSKNAINEFKTTVKQAEEIQATRLKNINHATAYMAEERNKHTNNNKPKTSVKKTENINNATTDMAEENNKDLVKKAFYIPVERSEEIQTARMELPICGEEQIIMETISQNSVVIICGETGSGKTTQIPQFLYEAGYGNKNSDNPGIIGITQPRRVAAISMSKRVAYELSLSDQEVSYQVVSPKTVIKFMTDGVLLRELTNDFLLTKYSVIIIDEAHERTLNTDILIGVVSRVLNLRRELNQDDKNKIKPLKIIIMSATLRISDFTENKTLFKIPPPIINVNTRQYPVSIHFNKRTPHINHISEAFKKVCKIHTRLPHGGILVFLTGQNEISVLCKKLRKKYPNTLRYQKSEIFSENQQQPNPLHILPLYSLLSSKAQLRVFEPPPEGTRLCVVATNVAETSLTIPGIKYVVDCGKVKQRKYDAITGVQSFTIDWTSKASADQRAGRAGRTGPGHCYRLYSSAVYNDQFQEFTPAEIHRMPIEGVVLQMKSMNLDNIVNFPFPTPPNRDQLLKAENLLKHMNALDDNTGQITELGRVMATFPIAPRFSKMLIIGQQHGCLPYIIAIVAALSVGDPFIKDYQIDDNDIENESESEEEEDITEKQELNEIQKESMFKKERRKLMKKRFYEMQRKHAGLDPNSDILKILNVVGAYEYEGCTEKFCNQNFVRIKAMQEIHKLRGQITNLVQTNFPGVNVYLDPKMKPPSSLQLKAIRQMITAGFIDQVAVRKNLIDKSSDRSSSRKGIVYSTMWTDDDVYIHPSSILYHAKPPDFVVYQELHYTNKVWMKGITVIEANWLSKLGKSFKKKDSEMTAYVTPNFGPKSWELPPIKAKAQKVGGRWVFGKI